VQQQAAAAVSPKVSPGVKKAAPPKQAAAPKVPQCKALYDYAAAGDNELSFRAGEIITIIQRDPVGWWEGELNGRRGWIPANYVQEI
jgi:myosin-1